MSVDSISKMSYNDWFLSAIKSSIVENKIDEKKLIKNCQECSNQVKSLLNSDSKNSEQLFEEFRLNSTLLLLLGCPSIKTAVENLSDLVSLVKSVPVLEEINVLSVVKNLKNYRHFRGILPWLPTKVSISLLLQFLEQFKTVTPLTLAMSHELFWAIMYSLQFNKENESNIRKCFELFTDFLKLPENLNNKLRAYHFLYVLESLYLCESLLHYQKIEEPPTFSLGLKIKSKFEKETEKIIFTKSQYESVIESCLYQLLFLSNSSVSTISSEIWILWFNIKSPTFGLILNSENKQDLSQNSLQLRISQTAFKIIELVKKKLVTSEKMKLSSFEELNEFLSMVAVDPNHDPDMDLSNEEIVEYISTVDEAKRKKKLVGILFTQNEIFNCNSYLVCAKENIDYFPSEIAISFVNKIIERFISEEETLHGWKRVAVEISRLLDKDELVKIINSKLKNGQSECLKTPDFAIDLTQSFNQLSDNLKVPCFDTYIWLCLQSGVKVVERSVAMATALPGTAAVVALALTAIRDVCRSKTANENFSTLTGVLFAKLNSLLADTERNEIVVLICKLLEERQCALDVSEFMLEVVCPKLMWKEGVDEDQTTALVIIESVTKFHMEVILSLEKDLCSLVVCMIVVHSNCASLLVKDAKRILKMRESTRRVLKLIVGALIEHKQDCAKEICGILACLKKFSIDRRSFDIISPLISAHLEPTSIGNNVQSKVDSIYDTIRTNLLDQHLGHQICQQKEEIFSNFSRIEWIWAMYLILPNCCGEEWLSAFKLTDDYLSKSVTKYTAITSTVELFYEVFLLWCDREAKRTDFKNVLPIALCFNAFSTAVTTVLTESLSRCACMWDIVCRAFSFWCSGLTTLRCDPEPPCVFLGRLADFLTTMVTSEAVVVVDNAIESSSLVNSTSRDKKKWENSKTCDTNIDSSRSSSSLSVDPREKNDDVSNVKKSTKKATQNGTFSSDVQILSRCEFERSIADLVELVSRFTTSDNAVSATVAAKLGTLARM